MLFNSRLHKITNETFKKYDVKKVDDVLKL